jgi:hypothetical protein
MDKGLFAAYDEILEESWDGMTMNRPPIKGGLQSPTDSKNTLSSTQAKIGIDQGSLLAQSEASGQNPYEQEESGAIDKQRLFKMIDYLLQDLDNAKITDRTAIMILGKLKNWVK